MKASIAHFPWAFLAFCLLWFPDSTARADGLIFQLPADGCWATYTLKAAVDVSLPNSPDPQKMDLESTVTVSSVGRMERLEQICRWIELRIDNPTRPGLHSQLILKMLIPEEFLTRGQDPLAHAIETHFNEKDVDVKAGGLQSFIEMGFNRVQYEIDRFRNVFPQPLENVRALAHESLVEDGREWRDCEVIEGTSRYDGALIDNGRMVASGKYRYALNPAAPFGVVSVHAEIDEKEHARGISVTNKIHCTLTLAKTGAGAVSSLISPGTLSAKTPSAGQKDTATNQLAPPGSDELVQPYAAIAEVERTMHARNLAGFQQAMLFGTSAAAQKLGEVFADNVREGRFAEVLVTPLEARIEGPVVCVVIRWAQFPTARPLLMTWFLVRREGTWRVLQNSPAITKATMTADEQAVVDRLDQWAEDWKKAHPSAREDPANRVK